MFVFLIVVYILVGRLWVWCGMWVLVISSMRVVIWFS